MFQNVAYRLTVYKTVAGSKNDCLYTLLYYLSEVAEGPKMWRGGGNIYRLPFSAPVLFYIPSKYVGAIAPLSSRILRP